MASDMNTTALGLRPASEPDRNIVLVGRTGNGKSSTGNSLLGEKMFLAKRQAAGVTLRCEMRTAAIQDGSIINVIDTPGLFDFAVSADFLSREITKCLDMAEEGLHAVLFVLSARTRISQEDESTINALQVIFGSKMFDYMIVVFTGGDELKEDNSTLEEYLSEGCPEFLKAVLRMCDGRKIMFDNKTKDKVEKDKQVQELLAHVETVYRNTKGKPFTGRG